MLNDGCVLVRLTTVSMKNLALASLLLIKQDKNRAHSLFSTYSFHAMFLYLVSVVTNETEFRSLDIAF